MRKFIGFILAVSCLFCVIIFPCRAMEDEFHWYCTRNKEHKQALVPPELAFVEECGGYYIDHRHGDDVEEKVVYLTFDAGYENGNVEKILDILKETNTTAAFFVLKHLVEANSNLICRMQDEGHLICNHTAHHKNLSQATPKEIIQEIKELEDAVEKVIGKPTATYFRPPEGSFSKKMLQEVSALGYRTVFWSFAYADWDNKKQPNPKESLDRILRHMHNGAVILLHPTSQTNVTILPELIRELQSQGYRFGSLDELCIAR